MDELETLREFRSGVRAAAPDEAVRERTMTAIRALIEQEALNGKRRPAPEPRRRHWLPMPIFSRRRVAAIAVIAVALVAALTVLPTHESSPSLVGQALAAIGSGSVLHVVAEQPTGHELIDLASGKTTPLIQQEEIWFDEDQGLRRDIIRINGRIADDSFQSPSGGFTPHGIIYDCAWIAAHPTQATKARVSCNASGDNGTTPRTIPRPRPTLDPGLLGFVDGYRNALATGAAREGGKGTVAGTPVDWLILKTADGDERVALDAATHKPILLNGPHASEQMRITAIETIDNADGKFVKPSPDETPVLPNSGRAHDQQTLDLNAAAVQAAYPGAVWAGLEIGDLPLASATVQTLTTNYPDHRDPLTGTGLQLQYGSLTANGHRDYTKPYLTISEAPSAELAIAYMWGFAGAAPPPPGQLLTEVPHSGPDALYLGFLTTSEKLVSIQASSEQLLLTAARALAIAK